MIIKFEYLQNLPIRFFLNKLVNVYIFQSNYTDFNTPIGTGPYYIKSSESVNITLERFDSYWGPSPYYKEAFLTAITDPELRLSAILSNEVQVLANVPHNMLRKWRSLELMFKTFLILKLVA